MNLLKLIAALAAINPKLPPTATLDRVQQHTNPRRNGERGLSKLIGHRQARRQTRMAYKRRAMGLRARQVLS